MLHGIPIDVVCMGLGISISAAWNTVRYCVYGIGLYSSKSLSSNIVLFVASAVWKVLYM